MTKEEKQRGFELQGYIDSIKDMTLKEIAIKYLKKYRLPKFLARLLVKFSYPLLLAKDYELTELEAQIEKMKCDVKANIKYADTNTNTNTNKNNQMYCKLNAMINQWEIKEQ